MITNRTKIQLLIFVVITLVGVTYTGARYANLDRFILDTNYEVVANFQESGGIFVGGEVTYRGVGVGQVSQLELTDNGVDVTLKIESEWDEIPAETKALVGNRSAVGEQYVELQPKVDDGPFLESGSTIPVGDTATPIAVNTLLTNLSATVDSVDKEALRVSVSELGKAFGGTGPDLQRIIDTGNSFIKTADQNFDQTVQLIEDSNIVLNTQIDSESAIRNFASQLELFSAEVASADGDIRTVIDTGSEALNGLRQVIEENEQELGSLINNLVTTAEIFVDNIDGLEQVLSIYPYVVEGGFTVAAKNPETGLFDAHFGLIENDANICKKGYDPNEQRSPSDGRDIPMDEDAGCREGPASSNARGSQNLPRPAADYDGKPDALYDPETGKFTYGADIPAELRVTDKVAPESLGEDSWKWLFMQPMTSEQR